MSTKTMLIDAAHPEETRVVVLDGHRLEDFDVESSARRQLKGNIYLAKVTRVEPSLQAAFVEYGGNRHGFLAFSEIHPDYFQIPVADRQALQAAEVDEEPDQDEDIEPEGENDGQHVETLGGTDVEEVAYRRRPSVNPRNYKIQEVIKRRQILLVQVVKEERGNKGAALTTYISLAGRYCVLMPNTARRRRFRKIANGADRNRLKTILGDLRFQHGRYRPPPGKRSKSEISATMNIKRFGIRSAGQPIDRADAGSRGSEPNPAFHPGHVYPGHGQYHCRGRPGVPDGKGLHEAPDSKPREKGATL